MKRHTGFTLVELLVALFITAIVFALGYGAINQAVSNRTALQANQDRLLAVQTAVRTLVLDFTQLSPRPVRQPLGAGYLGAIVADARTPGLVTLTRGGWSNPAGTERSTLQRVRYVLDGQVLRREYWATLDAQQQPAPRSRQLLTDVKSVKLRFMDESHNWQDQWPPANLGPDLTERALRTRPIAVEVTLELLDWGVIVRLIEVAG